MESHTFHPIIDQSGKPYYLQPPTFHIIVIGAGPVGMTLAGLLALQKTNNVLLVEKREQLPAIPRAIHFDAETLRVWQRLGLHDIIQRETLPTTGLQLKNNQGKLLLKGRNSTDCGFPPSQMFYQPTVERILENYLLDQENVTFLKGWEVLDLQQTLEQVWVRLGRAGKVQSTETACYAVGTDGANSFVRKHIKLPMQPLFFAGASLKVDVQLHGKALKTLQRQKFPHAVVKTCAPKQPIVFVPGYGTHKRWEQVLTKKEVPRSHSATQEMADNLIAKFLPPNSWEIDHAVVYRYRTAIAKRWQKGRVFLAGDAAHVMPPFIGQGMCSGIRDAANLAWKLTSVLSGQHHEKLLLSYQTERFTHVLKLMGLTVLTGLLFTTHLAYLLQLLNRLPWLNKLLLNLTFPEEKLMKGILGSNRKLRGKLWIQVPLHDEKGTVWSDSFLSTAFTLIVSEQACFNADIQARLEKLCANYPFINGFVLVVSHQIATEKSWREPWRVLTDVGGKIEEWMLTKKAEVLLIRPDRYVYDGGKVEKLESMLQNLKKQLFSNEA